MHCVPPALQADQWFSHAARFPFCLSEDLKQKHNTMQTNDETRIRDTIERYVEAMRAGIVALLGSAFHEHANIFGDFGDDQMAGPIQTLFDRAAAELEPGATDTDYRVEIEDMEIAGDVASARVHERDFFGGHAREFFTFVQSPDGWRIDRKSWAMIG